MAPSIISDIELPRDIPESQQTAANAPLEKLFTLKGRTVVVTGAGRGLGITLATAVLEAGADAICLDVLPEPATAEWQEITKLQKSTGVYAIYRRCDITDETAVEATLRELAKEANQREKPIRSLINCAGIQQMKDAIDYPMDGFRRIMEVNVTGSYIIAKQFARLLRSEQSTGSAVLIASMSGQIANRVKDTLIIDRALANRVYHRDCTALLTIHRKPLSTRCVDLWHTNGDNMGFESTLFRLATFVLP